MKKTVKKTVKNRLNNLKPFQKGHISIATPEQKKAGWERRRQSQQIMDQITQRGDMTKKDFYDYAKKNKNNLTVHEATTIKYMKQVVSGKLLKDYLDRHVGKAPVGMELESDEKPKSRELTKKEKEMIRARLEADGLSYRF